MNMALPSMSNFTRYGWLRKAKLDRLALEVMTDLNLRPLNIEKPIGTLSGGNQQKVIIGRWVAADNKVFLFDEPTREIDIGAKSEIYNLIEKLAKQGKAIVVVSSEMPEIIRISESGAGDARRENYPGTQRRRYYRRKYRSLCD